MYKVRMSSDFFTVKGLEARTGLPSSDWKTAIIKELIDNALDAIEANAHKQIEIEYVNGALRIFDNGVGLTIDNIKDIYDFNNYASRNRHIITASRGKQGNGLKTIIGMSFVNDYKLTWHTSDGIALIATVDINTVNDEKLSIAFAECGKTIKNGVEVSGIGLESRLLSMTVEQYSQCNPDVNFNVKFNECYKAHKAIKEPVNKTGDTSLAFYSYQDFVNLLKVQEPSETYKSFLEKYFGTRIKNSSQIKSQIEGLDINEVKRDFEMLRGSLNKKPFTLLKKHLLGYEHNMETYVNMESNSETLTFPCMVEFQVEKSSIKRAWRTWAEINCYVNNSITYANGHSIKFESCKYKISNTKKEVSCDDLQGLLADYSDYIFNFHFIAPYPKFMDYGKTEFDISDFVTELVDKLRKTLHKEKKKIESTSIKSPTKKSLAEKHMTDAFLLASTEGKYSITARQMYYKLRELIGRKNPAWETDSTYREFTQNWLTTWLDEHDEFENKVNFSERGNFYVEGSQIGLGTANVRNFTDNINTRPDKFMVYGGLQGDIFIDDNQFNISYKYDKALYIEKTGFDAVFKAERLDEKYNLLIVSGQGFASRAARRLLYNLQEQGLRLFCMHDLDISGVTIFNSMRQANDKFEYDLDMVDLGITPDDVVKYHIVPESTSAAGANTLEKLSREYRSFFEGIGSSHRVELNAFSTEQLLELIDNKLRKVNKLPTINLSKSLELDNGALRETALMRIIKDKYEEQLKKINLDCDLSEYDGRLTLPEAKSKIPYIKEDLISQYVEAIRRQIAI